MKDASRLNREMLTTLCKRGVSSVQDGQSPEIVSKAFGACGATTYGWFARYRAGGWSALDARKRGGVSPNWMAMARLPSGLLGL